MLEMSRVWTEQIIAISNCYLLVIKMHKDNYAEKITKQ